MNDYKIEEPNVNWKLKCCTNYPEERVFIEMHKEKERQRMEKWKSDRGIVPSSMLKHFRRRRLTQKWGRHRARKMHWNCTALFSLLCNMEICGTGAMNTLILTNTHASINIRTHHRHTSTKLLLDYDVQWQMNNVKWLIVLHIIINIVINFSWFTCTSTCFLIQYTQRMVIVHGA